MEALPSTNVLALVDNAFDTNFLARLRRRLPLAVSHSLYEGCYEGQGLDEIAPAVIQLPDESESRQDFVSFLLRETTGKPMLSFVHGIEPVAHLKRQMEAEDVHGKRFLVRFADTRSLGALLDVLDETQRNRFLKNLQWWYFDRDGTLRHVPHFVGPSDNLNDEPYVFSEVQMRKFDELARPDALLRFIQTHPHWMGYLTCSPSQAHACIVAALRTFGADIAMHDATVMRKVVDELTEANLLTSEIGGLNRASRRAKETSRL